MLYHAIYVALSAEPPALQIMEQSELTRYVEGFDSHEGDIAIGDTLIGAAWVRLIEGYGFVDPQTPELSIAILPGYQGQGIGTQLMTALFDITDRQYPQISLSVSENNPARRLYERLGFMTRHFSELRAEGSKQKTARYAGGDEEPYRKRKTLRVG